MATISTCRYAYCRTTSRDHYSGGLRTGARAVVAVSCSVTPIMLLIGGENLTRPHLESQIINLVGVNLEDRVSGDLEAWTGLHADK